MQGSQWGTGLLCGTPQLWDEGAVITGEGALGMQGKEHIGCREDVGYRVVQQSSVGTVWGWDCTGGCRGAEETCGCSVGCRMVQRV